MQEWTYYLFIIEYDFSSSSFVVANTRDCVCMCFVIYDYNMLYCTTERPVFTPIYQKELSKLWMYVFSTLFFIELETAKQKLMN